MPKPPISPTSTSSQVLKSELRAGIVIGDGLAVVIALVPVPLVLAFVLDFVFGFVLVLALALCLAFMVASLVPLDRAMIASV
jgi:hypothetical protein